MVNAGYTNWHQTTVGKTEAGQRPLRLNEAVALGGLLGIPLTQLLAPLQVDADAVAAEIERTEAELAALNKQAGSQAETLAATTAARTDAEVAFLRTGETIEATQAYLASLRAFQKAISQPDADATALGYQQVLRAFRPARDQVSGQESDR